MISIAMPKANTKAPASSLSALGPVRRKQELAGPDLLLSGQRLCPTVVGARGHGIVGFRRGSRTILGRHQPVDHLSDGRCLRPADTGNHQRNFLLLPRHGGRHQRAHGWIPLRRHRLLHDSLCHSWVTALPGGDIGVHHPRTQIFDALRTVIGPLGRLRRLIRYVVGNTIVNCGPPGRAGCPPAGMDQRHAGRPAR